MRQQIFLLFCFFYFNVAIGQQQSIIIQDRPLVEALKIIEDHSTLTFNYNPELLETYEFSGELEIGPSNAFLETVFYHTPFEFEISAETVVVYLPEQKERTLCGYIYDGPNDIPLHFANVIADDNIHGTQSDEEGYFEFSFTAHKNQEVTIAYVGYEERTLMVQELEGVACLKIKLEANKHLFSQEVVVRDYILDGITEGEAYSSVEMDYEQLSNMHSIVEHDVLKTVQLIPGVSSLDETATNLQIRGGTADQNLLLWEGATVYDPGHLFGMISSINPFVLDDIKVFKGVYNPSYENRVGGVVDMSLGDSIPKRFHGGLGSTLTEAHAFLEFPLVEDQLSFLFSGRKTLNGFINTPTLESYSGKVFQASKVSEETEDPTEQLLDFYDWNGKLLFKPVDRLLLSLSYFKTSNQFDFNSLLFEGFVESNDAVQSGSEVLSFAAQWELSSKWKSQWSYSSSGYSNNYSLKFIDVPDQLTIEHVNIYNDISDKMFSWTNRLDLSKNWDVQFGYERSILTTNFNFTYASFYEPDFEDFDTAEANFHHYFIASSYQKGKWQIDGGNPE